MENIEIVKVELSEENLIKPIKIELKNGNTFVIRPDTSEDVHRGNIHVIFLD